MKSYTLLIVMVLSSACTMHNPSAPTSPAAAPLMSEMDYDINVPTPQALSELRFAHPDGVHTSPLNAQHLWDYTAAYGGSPNVYFGDVSPHCQYIRAGIVVAPISVAGRDTFTAGDWPRIGLEPGLTYVWVGRFVYTSVALPGSYVSDPSGAMCWQPTPGKTPPPTVAGG